MRVHLKHLVFRFYKSFFKSQGLTQIEIEPLNHTSEEKEAEGDIFKSIDDIKNFRTPWPLLRRTPDQKTLGYQRRYLEEL